MLGKGIPVPIEKIPGPKYVSIEIEEGKSPRNRRDIGPLTNDKCKEAKNTVRTVQQFPSVLHVNVLDLGF